VPIPRSSGKKKQDIADAADPWPPVRRAHTAGRWRPWASAALEGRRAAEDTFLLGPHRLALGKRHREFILDPAALVPVNSVPQLSPRS